MEQTNVRIIALVVAILTVASGGAQGACAQAHATAYPTMAPLEQYLMPDVKSEIALARSAAPPAIADSAEVMVLGQNGYTVAVKGQNGFLCIVERSWAKNTNDPEFWNPKVRGPNCFNAQAASTLEPVYLMKTKLVLAGRSRAAIARAITSAFETKELPALAPGAMCYMMSKEQYLGDRAKGSLPHVMFFRPGDAAKSWGANLPGSPISAVRESEARATVFIVLVHRWSDGTPGPPLAQ